MTGVGSGALGRIPPQSMRKRGRRRMDGSYQLLLGDCLELLQQYPDSSIDALVTDPPFSMAGGLSNGSSSNTDSQFFAFWWRALCTQLSRVLKPEGEGFIWCDWRTAALLADGFKPKRQTYDVWRLTQIIHHYREMPGQGKPFRNSVDLIAYVAGPKSTGRRIPNTTHNFLSKYWYYGKHENHPSEKDPEVCQQLVEWCSDPHDLIIDPFMGSGTVGIACALSARRFLGIEKDDAHFPIAETRITEAYACYPGSTVKIAMPLRALPLFTQAP